MTDTQASLSRGQTPAGAIQDLSRICQKTSKVHGAGFPGYHQTQGPRLVRNEKNKIVIVTLNRNIIRILELGYFPCSCHQLCHQLKSAEFGRAVCGNKRRRNGKPLEYPHIGLTHFKVRLELYCGSQKSNVRIVETFLLAFRHCFEEQVEFHRYED